MEVSVEHHGPSPHQVGNVDDGVYKNNRIREEVRNDVEAFETDKKIKSFEKGKSKLLKNWLQF